MAEPRRAETEPTAAVPVSFQDLGIPAPPKLQDTLLGKARQFQDIEWRERVYIASSVLTLLATFSFTIYKICTVSSRDPDFTFALVLLVSTLFAIYYTLHGVLQERATELLVLCVAVTGVLLYLVVNYAAGRKDTIKLGGGGRERECVVLCVAITGVLLYLIVNYAAGRKDTIKLVRLIIAAVLCPFLIGMGLYLSVSYYRTGNLIFRMVGANTELQNMCRLLFLFFDLLKFDLQLSISMVILILTSRLDVDTEDIVVLSVGGFFTIVWFLIAYNCMKRENRVGAIVFFVFSPVEVAYIIYKLYQASTYMNEYSGLAGSTIACGVIALLVRGLLITVAVFVYRNFRKGLKGKAFGFPPEGTLEAERPPQNQHEFVP
ncbi:hypothetical protein ACOMHN_030188 [Nucella lapillus]